MNKLLFDPEKSGLTGKQSVAATQSHVVANVWFGDIVTMKWWDNHYLNKGMVQPPIFRGDTQLNFTIVFATLVC
jgi:hypothetical protein